MRQHECTFTYEDEDSGLSVDFELAFDFTRGCPETRVEPGEPPTIDITDATPLSAHVEIGCTTCEVKPFDERQEKAIGEWFLHTLHEDRAIHDRCVEACAKHLADEEEAARCRD